ncbi:MAG: hypothetical protein MUC41_04655 [Syntrophobacteraceae bacterium]|jgi:hypothetical protein|nr:hypothetical protein [Syntrophobacteraceae bacterium]
MKQYVIDQLRESDYEKVLGLLDLKADKTGLEGIYWVNLPERLYSAVQREHVQCQPHYFAVNLDFNRIAFELLIRSRQIIRCSCIAYATPEQRDYILRFADETLERLGLLV